MTFTFILDHWGELKKVYSLLFLIVPYESRTMSIKISITNLQGEFHKNILEFSYQAFFS